MRLPEYERVLFRNSPLRQVLGQAMFPLLVDFGERSSIAAFHGAVKDDYPKASRVHRNVLQFSSGAGRQDITETLWRFTSKDEAWALVLGETSVTLEVAGYSSIDVFLQRFSQALNAASSVLHVSEHGRIGLRYINEFRHPKGLTLLDWGRLLRPEFIGELASDLLPGSIVRSIQEIQAEPGDGDLVVRHGFLIGSVVEQKTPADQLGPFYLLDMDYFSSEAGPLDITAITELFRSYNDLMYRLFRWTLSDDLFNSLGPRH